jgi:hypothetical protein
VGLRGRGCRAEREERTIAAPAGKPEADPGDQTRARGDQRAPGSQAAKRDTDDVRRAVRRNARAEAAHRRLGDRSLVHLPQSPHQRPIRTRRVMIRGAAEPLWRLSLSTYRPALARLGTASAIRF